MSTEEQKPVEESQGEPEKKEGVEVSPADDADDDEPDAAPAAAAPPRKTRAERRAERAQAYELRQEMARRDQQMDELRRQHDALRQYIAARDADAITAGVKKEAGGDEDKEIDEIEKRQAWLLKAVRKVDAEDQQELASEYHKLERKKWELTTRKTTMALLREHGPKEEDSSAVIARQIRLEYPEVTGNPTLADEAYNEFKKLRAQGRSDSLKTARDACEAVLRRATPRTSAPSDALRAKYMGSPAQSAGSSGSDSVFIASGSPEMTMARAFWGNRPGRNGGPPTDEEMVRYWVKATGYKK